jgi:hypothetical protein
MNMTDQSATTDYTKHSDEELREGITKSEENLRRIEQEGSEDQLAAAKDQHDAMQAELSRRQS